METLFTWINIEKLTGRGLFAKNSSHDQHIKRKLEALFGAGKHITGI